MKSKSKFLSMMAAGLAALLPGGKGKKSEPYSVGTLGGNVTKTHGREPFSPWWLFLKGAPSRHIPGQQEIPQWRWPDKDRYGQAKDGSIRHATMQTPFRVRRWRKRAAAKIAKSGGHTIQYAKEIVKNIEAGIVRDQIKRLDNQTRLDLASKATA